MLHRKLQVAELPVADGGLRTPAKGKGSNSRPSEFRDGTDGLRNMSGRACPIKQQTVSRGCRPRLSNTRALLQIRCDVPSERLGYPGSHHHKHEPPSTDLSVGMPMHCLTRAVALCRAAARLVARSGARPAAARYLRRRSLAHDATYPARYCTRRMGVRARAGPLLPPLGGGMRRLPRRARPRYTFIRIHAGPRLMRACTRSYGTHSHVHSCARVRGFRCTIRAHERRRDARQRRSDGGNQRRPISRGVPGSGGEDGALAPGGLPGPPPPAFPSWQGVDWANNQQQSAAYCCSSCAIDLNHSPGTETSRHQHPSAAGRRPRCAPPPGLFGRALHGPGGRPPGPFRRVRRTPSASAGGPQATPSRQAHRRVPRKAACTQRAAAVATLHSGPCPAPLPPL